MGKKSKAGDNLVQIQLLTELKQSMLQEIPRAVKEFKLSNGDEVCYISLLGTNYEPLLGLITLGIKSCRDEMLQEGSIDKLWKSGAMPCQYQIGLEKLPVSFAEKQEQFVDLHRNGDQWEDACDVCRQIRCEVAYQLNGLNWSTTIPVTDDFVVYSEWEAIDVKNGDLERSIPKDKLSLLKERGLLLN